MLYTWLYYSTAAIHRTLLFQETLDQEDKSYKQLYCWFWDFLERPTNSSKIFIYLFLLILESERGRGERDRHTDRQRHQFVVPPIYASLVLPVCALTRDWTCNLGYGEDVLTNWVSWPEPTHQLFKIKYQMTIHTPRLFDPLPQLLCLPILNYCIMILTQF